MHNFFFGIFPYIAITVMVVGSIARYETDPFTWKSSSSQLLRRKQLIMGSVLFHVGVLVIFFGHLFGLLTPLAIFEALGISHSAKKMMAVVVGGLAGIMALAGGIMLLQRRLGDPRIRATSSFADIAILVMILAQLVIGLGTILVSMATGGMDGYKMVSLMHWAQGILTFQAGAADFVIGMPWVTKLHLLLGLTIFLVFPFTRLVHMLSVPVRYIWRPGYQVVRSRRKPQTPAE